MQRPWFVVVLISAFLSLSSTGQDTPPVPPSTQPSQADLEKRFAETMTNAVLVGRFSTGRSDREPREERYTISSARKVMGDRWLITARIQYGNRGETAPIPLIVPVKWAGDTPVISVTDLTIPGMGTYTARVMIFKDQYAGMWDAGDHGGLMWGRIERAATPPVTPQPPAAPAR